VNHPLMELIMPSQKTNPVMLLSGLRQLEIIAEGEPEMPHRERTESRPINLFQEHPPQAWVERPGKVRKKQIPPPLASGHKFCRFCGKKFFPQNGELLAKWTKARSCGVECSAKSTPPSKQAGKFCMKCGAFHPRQNIHGNKTTELSSNRAICERCRK